MSTRMMLFLLLFFPVVPFSPVAGETAPKTGPWDIKTLESTVVKPVWGETKGKVRELTYPGEMLKGKPTRIFAYYARPDKGDGPFPAVVLVHGGGGTAFRDWALHWADRGYCALAMDLSGNSPGGRLADGGPDQADSVKFQSFDANTARDMWTYHAVAAVIRGHNLVRDLPEVDKNRTAITGISWGGYLTCIIAGLDHRFAAAVPVYGCGYLHENSVWKEPQFARMAPEQSKQWVDYFDPSRYLAGVRCPILFLNGTNDFAYPLDSYKKCYDLVSGTKSLSVQVRLPHGHIWSFKEVDTFIDSYLKKGTHFPEIGPLERKGERVECTFKADAGVKSARLNYAIAKGPWQQREWKSIEAKIGNNTIQALLPGEKPLVFYLELEDKNGIHASTPHQISDQ